MTAPGGRKDGDNNNGAGKAPSIGLSTKIALVGFKLQIRIEGPKTFIPLTCEHGQADESAPPSKRLSEAPP